MWKDFPAPCCAIRDFSQESISEEEGSERRPESTRAITAPWLSEMGNGTMRCGSAMKDRVGLGRQKIWR